MAARAGSAATRRERPLAGGIRLATVGVAAASVLAVFVVFFTFWALLTTSQTTQELSVRVQAVARALSGTGNLTNDRGIRQKLFRIEAGLIGATLFVTDAQGNVLEASSGERLKVRLPVRDVPGAAGVQTGIRGIPGMGSSVIVAAPLSGMASYPTAAWLVGIEPLRELNRSRGWVVLLLLGCAVLAVLIAWLAGGLLAGRIAAPIVRLRDAARAVATGDWGHQVPVEGAEEVAELARSFNSMSSKVADAYRAQRDFVGDVSHELRTPITSIQGFSGALLDGTVTDPADQRRYLGVIRDESLRLGDLTASLLALAELDSGEVRVAAAPVDTAKLGEALAVRYRPLAEERGISLDVLRLPGAPVGDHERILQALSTLVDNALAYTPAGGTVRVAPARAGSGRWAVAVDDTGPGIPADRREEVFGRFARLDASRATESGGSGLGLAICRRTLEIMEGSVRAEDGELGGARFVVELPEAP
jgi:signal transduction histidine kinase